MAHHDPYSDNRGRGHVIEPSRQLHRSFVLFTAVSAIFIGIKLLFAFYPGEFPIKSQTEAFSWPLIGAILLIGLGGLFGDHASGLPVPFAERLRGRHGLFWSVLTGLAYGCLTVVMQLVHPTTSILNTRATWDHVEWPWSVPFYTFGAIFLEFLLRLGGICIIFWLVHVLILRRRWRSAVFWIIAAVISLYEIMPYMQRDIAQGNWGRAALSLLEPLYWTNLFEGWLLWRFGWLMPIVFRLAFYLVWHVIYGGLARPAA
jgi:hypothetical protein